MADFETDLLSRLSEAPDIAGTDISGGVIATLKLRETAKRRTGSTVIAALACVLAVASTIAVIDADGAFTQIAASSGLGWALRVPVAITAAIISVGISAISGIVIQHRAR